MPLNYELSFADIPFVADDGKVIRLTPPDPPTYLSQDQNSPRIFQPKDNLYEELNRMIPFQYLQDFVPTKDNTDHNLNAVASKNPPYPFPDSTVRIGEWYYPNTASRWSVFRGLATSKQVKEMVRASQQGSSLTAPIPDTRARWTARNFIMRAATTGPTSQNIATYTIETDMHLMPPRPLGENMGLVDGLYLVTLVDERYFWQYISTPLHVNGRTTWDDLISQLSVALAVPIEYSAIPAAYSRPEPDSQLWSNYESAATLLDAIAYNIGCVVVRNLDGSIELQNATQSQATVLINRATLIGVGEENPTSTTFGNMPRVAGGDVFNRSPNFPVGNLSPAKNAVVGPEVSLSFPKYVIGNDPVPHFLNPKTTPPQNASVWWQQSYGDTYVIDIPITSGGAAVSGLLGSVGITPTINSTAKAYFTSESSLVPINASGLQSLALLHAENYYTRQVASSLDVVLPGTFNWQPEGFNDIIWTYSIREGRATTRILRAPWNQVVADIQPSAPTQGFTLTSNVLSGQSFPNGAVNTSGNYLVGAVISGMTGIPPGVGGPLVAQSWLAGNSGAVGFPLNPQLIGNFTSSDTLFHVNTVAYLPTQNRWRGQLGNETILFEGTSGGIAAGGGVSGYALKVAYRGIDGTIAGTVSSGTSLYEKVPSAAYGVNLVSLGRGLYSYVGYWTSGGIQGVELVPQVQTVLALTDGGVCINGVTHYSGQVYSYDPSITEDPLWPEELVWIVERNTKTVSSGMFFAGQFVGYSSQYTSGCPLPSDSSSSSSAQTLPAAPVYLINDNKYCCESSSSSSTSTTSGSGSSTSSASGSSRQSSSSYGSCNTPAASCVANPNLASSAIGGCCYEFPSAVRLVVSNVLGCPGCISYGATATTILTLAFGVYPGNGTYAGQSAPYYTGSINLGGVCGDVGVTLTCDGYLTPAPSAGDWLIQFGESEPTILADSANVCCGSQGFRMSGDDVPIECGSGEGTATVNICGIPCGCSGSSTSSSSGSGTGRSCIPPSTFCAPNPFQSSSSSTTRTCFYCAGSTPFSWSGTLAGFEGCYARFNGDVELYPVDGTSCTWEDQTTSLSAGGGVSSTNYATLSITKSGLTLELRSTFSDGTSSFLQYNLPSFGADCCSPQTLTYVEGSALCTNPPKSGTYPPTVTLTPSCTSTIPSINGCCCAYPKEVSIIVSNIKNCGCGTDANTVLQGILSVNFPVPSYRPTYTGTLSLDTNDDFVHPSCQDCSTGTPSSWTLTVAGMTNCFSLFNGDHTLTQDQGCIWSKSLGSSNEHSIRASVSNLGLIVTLLRVETGPGTTAVAQYEALVPDNNCCNPVTVNLFNDQTNIAGCAGYSVPSSLTLTPNCSHVSTCDDISVVLQCNAPIWTLKLGTAPATTFPLTCAPFLGAKNNVPIQCDQATGTASVVVCGITCPCASTSSSSRQSTSSSSNPCSLYDNVPGAKNYTVPAGVTSLTVYCWGAGGAGGGGANPATAPPSSGGGGGGGGGAVARSTISVTPGQVISYYVGQGGAPGVGIGTGGQDGESTTFFGVTIEAAGGKGGSGGGTGTPGAGGAIADSVGDSIYAGGDGGAGIGGGGGGGGASAELTQAGAPGQPGVGGVPPTGGSGGACVVPGSPFCGNGGDGGGAGFDGEDGLSPGGGGGGGGQIVIGNRGGSGKSGAVWITCTPSPTTCSTNCCGALPSTLKVTFTSPFPAVACPCATDSTITLTCDTVTNKWTGTGAFGSCGRNVTVSFYCNTGGTSVADTRLDVSFSDACIAPFVGKTPVGGDSCSPLSISFSLGMDVNCGCGVMGAILYATVTTV